MWINNSKFGILKRNRSSFSAKIYFECLVEFLREWQQFLKTQFREKRV